MTYTGHASPGGPSQTRSTGQLEITKLAVGPMDNNCYLLRSRSTGASLLIDAAAEPDRIIEMCDRKVDQILTTHGHADHWSALAEVKRATGAITKAHQADRETISVPTDEEINDGDVIQIGDVALRVVLLVGHTPGSVALIHRDSDGSTHVFSGDSLFPGGVGNTWGLPGAFESLLDDVTEKIFDALPDGTWVYPGHGDDTTLGKERPHLAEWRARGW